ncbi:MAG TPA: SDR family oxidoreductase [Geminicoccus sp.]|uniref:SDR family NAD(P)-dependent oxidoreductase n=1 Tax=Geminicoccus sp. TaxID=2024832 RepID=UPI002E33C366|nr:SDR family oxidoreductase [Geminicoccus sp.]HEX2528113.1 SDR family oxidoreductase [Geminicoccus sp.]
MGVLDLFRVDGKRLMVTGGSRGLGRAMALAIAEAGADVILTGRTQETLDSTAGEIRALGRQAWTILTDMADPADCERACQEALAIPGQIDILINNVGNREANIPTEEMPLETWQKMVDLNLTSAFLCTKLIGGSMLDRPEGGGKIINIASISAIIANRGIHGRHYETAKAALLHFTKATAADWATRGVNVNAICPGLFMTDANKRWNELRPEVIQTFVQQVPMGRPGNPEEIGPLALYLASPASNFVTGSAYVIDGGYLIW